MALRRELAARKIEGLASFGIVAPAPIYVESPKFQGSLATLFQCVRDRQIELSEIALFPICEAYFDYLLQSGCANVDEAASALTVLAYLLERKAWQLLPTPEPEPEIEEEAAFALPSAHEYRDAIEILRGFHDRRSTLFFRPEGANPDPYETPISDSDLGPQHLASAFAELMARAKPEPPNYIVKNLRSLSETIQQAILAIDGVWRRLTDLAPDPISVGEAAMWFLALLELMRLGQVSVQIADGEARFARARR